MSAPPARAVLLVRPGHGAVRRQYAAALDHLDSEPGLSLTAMTLDPRAAAALVAAGAVDVVLMVGGPPDLADLPALWRVVSIDRGQPVRHRDDNGTSAGGTTVRAEVTSDGRQC